LHQRQFFDQLESAVALVIFATTHKNAIQDALLNRFGANVYEMRRPTAADAVKYLQGLCLQQQVQASTEQLLRVAEHYAFDLRKCVDFVYTSGDQAPDGVVTDSFIQAVLGVQSVDGNDSSHRPKRLGKL